MNHYERRAVPETSAEAAVELAVIADHFTRLCGVVGNAKTVAYRMFEDGVVFNPDGESPLWSWFECVYPHLLRFLDISDNEYGELTVTLRKIHEEISSVPQPIQLQKSEVVDFHQSLSLETASFAAIAELEAAHHRGSSELRKYVPFDVFEDEDGNEYWAEANARLASPATGPLPLEHVAA